MTKELRGIIEKMVSENPDIMQIATDWSPSNIGTTIWVQFPSIEDQELANQFMEKYTDYVNDLFTPDYMYDDSHTLVFPQLERIESAAYIVFDSSSVWCNWLFEFSELYAYIIL